MLNNGDFLNWYNAKQYYSQVKDSDLVMIPQDHFESVIQSFLNIPISEIRAIPEYDFSEQAYYFLGWQTGYYSVVPRLPIPEVTDVRNNEDGTFTLIVDAVFPWYGTDCAFQHETTIRCKEDGTFHFIENHVIEHEKNIFPSNQLPALRKGAIYFAEHK